MRSLLPFTFADLGPVEWLFLLLVLGGLSLLVPAGPRRRMTAVIAAVACAIVGSLRIPGAGGSPWHQWIGPVLFTPAFVAGVVLLAHARPFLEARAGPRRLAAAWLGAIVLVAAIGRPFGLHPLADLADWAFLALLGTGVAGLACPTLLGRALTGGVRAWHAFAVALFLLCSFAEPFGVGWAGALILLALFAVIHAVLAQGPQMRRYVVRRLLGAPLVILVLMVASFVLIRSAPGGPFDKEKAVAPEMRERLNARYGYDKPLQVQFFRYMRPLLLDGDLGISTKQKGRSVNEIISEHAGPSVWLGLAATALALLIGLTSGLIAGMRRNSIFDYTSMTGAMIGLALPTFVVGPLLVLVFAMKLDWFHVAGWEKFPLDLVLPAFTLSLPFAARVARLTRAGMLEVVHQDYIRTARAKGLSETAIVLRHTLKGALLPVVTFLGPAVAQLLTGSLVVETIFGVPGLGVEFVQSALNRDYELALGLVVFFGTILIVFNLVVDIAYGFLDPRIRHA